MVLMFISIGLGYRLWIAVWNTVQNMRVAIRHREHLLNKRIAVSPYVPQASVYSWALEYVHFHAWKLHRTPVSDASVQCRDITITEFVSFSVQTR